MTLWAIVPIKPLRLGKSRLASVLSESERSSLNRRFLERTLEILNHVDEINQCLVISRDPAALAIAREYDARTILEQGHQNINSALSFATSIACNYAKRGLLILPADLPLLTAEVIREFITGSGDAPHLTIAPDRHETGTNGLLVRPAGLIKYYFGPGSFQKHIIDAQGKNAEIKIFRRMEFALDLDLPEDLNLYREHTKSTRELTPIFTI